MTLPVGKWRISLYLSERLEILTATVDVRDDTGHRNVLKMITGPFDTPEEVLSMLTELIDHAEWRGEQLSLPVSAFEK